ncbi:PAS domain-containing sensor histidine kinase [Romboutsia sedimentorum]|uniref:histidine kinase n=1 Tax=Romboutsia sedimentorum TaxID=1368474 RepID=A0ABT7E912_9FIRM|nr:PAS domain-containing sensor histidine kinase [Romboutsia sedimentorum]MDK2563197.1 PAS domain-containing sensor histidine kinase [Romboutsia sedimentorum]
MELKIDKQKLNLYKKHISSSANEIDLECRLQSQYKDEILELNTKISQSIEKSDNPIFILDNTKNYIYSNESFKKLIKLDKLNEYEFDIYLYLNLKFTNSDEVIKGINKNSSKIVKSYDGRIYKFISKRDIIEGKNIIICILNDITESMMIQNELAESEERCKKLMDILNDGVMIHDTNTITYINNKAIELFELEGNSHSEVLIDNVEANINKKFRKKFIDNINLVQFGKKDKSTTKIETKEGKTVEFITTNIVLNNKKMLLSIAIDISILENALTEIEQSEKTYKLLLQTLPEGIIIIDKQTNNYIYRNKAMIKILKDIGVDNLNNIIKKYLNKHENGSFKKFTVNNGQIRDINIAIINSSEENTFVVVVRLLDDKQKAEKMKETLAQISDKYRFKTEFLSDLSNDIKKPINTIFETNKILYLNKDRYDSQYIDNYTRLVRQNCYRLMRLLNNIQEIGNLENGMYKIDLKKYDIIKLVKDLVEKSKKYTNEKGLEIKFKSNVEKKIFAIDKEKIEKIILNLLSNSIKFTEKGGKITISVISEDEELKIYVKDTGVGIPEDKIDLIFESFEQVDRTLSRGAEGSGIGLSLVKKLVDAQDARISVKSEVDKGSEFIIILKDNIHQKQLASEVSSGYDFSDNEKIDIEFSDIYFNYSY